MLSLTRCLHTPYKTVIINSSKRCLSISGSFHSYGSNPQSTIMSILGAKKENGVHKHIYNVDLRSDTQTAPCQAMRKCLAEAHVGDDVYGEDATAIKLEKMVAEIAGMEAGLFVPSGTMGNLISIMVHCKERGSEIILGDKSHIHLYEQGNIAQFGGVHCRTVSNDPDGTFDLQKAESLIRSDDFHYPVSKVLVIENTQNKCGGKALPLSWIHEAYEMCARNGLALHCDAARIFNAKMSSGVPVKDLLSPWCDSASICLSKGLGAPIGSVIVGKKEFIQRARRLRKALGGGMRQVGIVAQAGIFAIQNNVEKLKVDHERCYNLALAINQLENSPFSCPSPHSNIVMIHIDETAAFTAEDLVQRLLEISDKEVNDLKGEGVRVYTLEFAKKTVRLIFHLSVTEEEYLRGSKKIIYVLKEFSKQSSL